MKRLVSILLIISFALSSNINAYAGGPLIVTNLGDAVSYSDSMILYRLDKGNIGTLSNTDATNIIQGLFMDWENINTSMFTFKQDSPGYLNQDINGSNFSPILESENPLGYTAVLFDDDGSIIDGLLGSGSSNKVLGFAGPTFTTRVGTNMLVFAESQAVFNGKFINGINNSNDPELSLNTFKSTVIHEFGHALGLDHSQINVESLDKTQPQSVRDSVPLMFPIAVNDLYTVMRDDRSAISFLYPNTTALASFGSIEGKLFRSNGTTEIYGANVIARNVANPLIEAVSCVSGVLATSSLFKLTALPPGDYTLEIEPINSKFTGGSSVGHFSDDSTDVSFQNPVTKGYYTGPNMLITTDKNSALIIMVTAGQAITGANILSNTSSTSSSTSSSSSSSSTSSSTGGISCNGSSITEFNIPTLGSRPIGITAGPDGNIWFTEEVANKIGKITPTGTFSEFNVPNFTNPQGITKGTDGNLWFNQSNGKIGKITPTGTITEFNLPSNTLTTSIAAGPDGNIWFTEIAANKIGKITPTGTITEFIIPTANSRPIEITAGTDGNLWFTEEAGNKIGKITPTGTITEFNVPTNDSSLFGITAGPDGNIWFTEGIANKIGKITPSGTIAEFNIPTTGAAPLGIVSGPDGNLWFAEGTANKIGRITVSGSITEFAIQTIGSSPWGITKGPDGNIWFTEERGNKIGKITCGNNSSSSSSTSSTSGSTGSPPPPPNGTLPTCNNNVPTCGNGSPYCPLGKGNPVCRSVYGSIKTICESVFSIDPDAAYCGGGTTTSSTSTSSTSSTGGNSGTPNGTLPTCASSTSAPSCSLGSVSCPNGKGLPKCRLLFGKPSTVCEAGSSIYADTAFCTSSSTSSTSSSTSSSTGGNSGNPNGLTPNCASGTSAPSCSLGSASCPSGKGVPSCKILFGKPTTICKQGFNEFADAAFCTSSSTSTSSTSGSTSSTSGTTGTPNGTLPFCNGSTPTCSRGSASCPADKGTPLCRTLSGKTVVACNSRYGSYYDTAFCTSSSTSTSSTSGSVSSSSTSSSSSSSTSSSTGGNSGTPNGTLPFCNGSTPTCSMGSVSCPSDKGTPSCKTLSGKVLVACTSRYGSYYDTAFCTNSFRTVLPSSEGELKSINPSPYCEGEKVKCNSGVASCATGTPICGSTLGFTGSLSGPGCTNKDMTTFDHRAVYCNFSETFHQSFSKEISLCDKEVLCPQGKRFEGCREDKTSCKCICPGEKEFNKFTPRCDSNNNAICSNGLKVSCSSDKNYPVCYDGKIICHDKNTGEIDLIDSIECR